MESFVKWLQCSKSIFQVLMTAILIYINHSLIAGKKTGKIPTDGENPLSHRIQTYYDLLEEECKPKANRMISVMQLWSNKSHQNTLSLNEWITNIKDSTDQGFYLIL